MTEPISIQLTQQEASIAIDALSAARGMIHVVKACQFPGADFDAYELSDDVLCGIVQRLKAETGARI